MPTRSPLTPIFDPRTRKGTISTGAMIGEIPAPPVTVTIDQDGDQNDPTATLPIVFDVVFSEAVTGFTSADVTLSGTAGATDVTVTNSGDDINYTVEVDGPLVGGTVIATIAAGVATSIATSASNDASTSTDNTVTWVDPLDWFGDSAPGLNGTFSPTYTGQSLALAISCVTRQSSEEVAGTVSTVDGYGGGESSGFDGFGASGALLQLGVEFGSRSRLGYRQDWLNFLDGDEYVVTTSAADHATSTAFYQLAYPWKAKQAKAAVNSGTALSVTLDSPVSAGSLVIVGVACLSANSVTVGPTGFTVDGTTDEPTQRTSRMSAWRSTGSDQTGEDTYTATLNSSTGGGAIVAIEIAQEDSLVTALPTAIRAQSGLLLYYPLQHTLSGEKSWGGSLSSSLSGTGPWITYDQAGEDGRSYSRHVTATNPANFPDDAQFTPNGNGGLTVAGLIRMDSLAAISTLWSKNTDAANFAKEWEIYVDTDGSLFAHTNAGSARPPATARGRRTAASTIAVDTWYFVIIRFGNGANDYPTIRINGSNITGTTSGSSAANADSSAVPTVGATYLNSTTRAMTGAMAHTFFCTTDISDADCAVIEAAAQADGWY